VEVWDGDGDGESVSTSCSGTDEYSADTGKHYTFRLTATDNAGNRASVMDAPSVGAETKYYVFGGRRVAVRSGGTVYWLHGDHLGSMSLTTNGSGDEVGRQLYRPFGAVRWVTGTLQTEFGFTGQRGNSHVRLIDYHARWYDPYLNRWISPDSIVPEPANPQSLNRYSYVYNSPLIYQDTDGHRPRPPVKLAAAIVGGVALGGVVALAVVPHIAPWDPPMYVTHRTAEPIASNNVTSWLRHQMVTNAQSSVVRSIRENWSSDNLLRKDAALQAWTALVGTGATWDFKVELEATPWYEGGVRNVMLGTSDLGFYLNYDIVANVHFGFVGRAAGFDLDFLVAAAGVAQAKRAIQTGDPDDRGTCNTTYYCDHPFATWSVQFGGYLYELYKDRLHELDDVAIAAALAAYIAEYGEPPDPPPGALAP
jgi:RHS repeat-associated protein